MTNRQSGTLPTGPTRSPASDTKQDRLTLRVCPWFSPNSLCRTNVVVGQFRFPVDLFA